MTSVGQTEIIMEYMCTYIQHSFWKESADKVCDDEEDISRKVIIVTGSNTGIGKATALQLAKRGAIVIMAVRDLRKGQEAREDIQKKLEGGGGPELKIDVMRLDLGDLQSIRNFVRDFEQKYSRLNILVNNGGLMDTNGVVVRTKDGFEQHIGVNHLGPFLLTRLLMNSLKKGAPSRVIFLASSSMAYVKFDVEDLMMKRKVKTADLGREPYALSKLCNSICIRKFALSLENDDDNRSFKDVRFFQLCPGYVTSDCLRHERGMLKTVLNTLSHAAVGLSPHQGCETVVYLATKKKLEPTAGKGEMYRFMRLWNSGNVLLDKYVDTEEADTLYRLSEQWVGIRSYCI